MNDNNSAYYNKFAGFVQILPNEPVLQFTNLNYIFDFNGTINAYLVDECGKVLKTFQNGYDIIFKPYINAITGITQTAFELITVEDYGEKLVMLKLASDGKSIFSYPFFSTYEGKDETSLIYYKSEGYFLGMPYDTQNYFQSIRLRCFKNDSDQETQNEEIIQLSGNKFYSRNVTTPVNKYLFYLCDFFTFNRLISLLSHNIIYINKQRHTSTPSKLTKGERIPDTNVFQLDFEANPIDEYIDISTQLLSNLQVISLYHPDDSFFGPGITVTKRFTVTFNRNIFIFDTSIKFNLYKSGVLIESKTPIAYQNTLYIDFATDFDEGQYYILVDSNKAGVNNPIENILWEGISDPNSWNFTKQDVAPPDPDPAVTISWADDTTIPISGISNQVEIDSNTLNISPSNPITYWSWQRKDINNPSTFIEYNNTSTTYTDAILRNGDNYFRLVLTLSNGDKITSNILQYTKEASSTIYITDKVLDITMGTCTYKLHVEGMTFIGFANVVGTKGSRLKTSKVNVNPFGSSLMITASVPVGTDVFKSTAVTIPIGVYNCSIDLNGTAAAVSDDVVLDGAISYGYNNDYYSGIADAEAKLYIPGDSGPL